jgi:hypothetical protein
VLRTVPLEPIEWKGIMLASLAIIPFDMLRKLIVLPFLPKVRSDNWHGSKRFDSIANDSVCVLAEFSRWRTLMPKRT